jgi:hypothetical protein
MEAARHIQGIVDAPDANISRDHRRAAQPQHGDTFELARARGAMTEEMYYQVAGAFCASCLQGCRNNA